MKNQISEELKEVFIKANIEFISHNFPFPSGVPLPKVGQEFEHLGLIIESRLGKGRMFELKIIPMKYKKDIYIRVGNWTWGTNPEDKVSQLQ